MENAVRALERPFAPRHSLFRHRQARRQQDNQQSGPNRLGKFDYGIALVPRMANYANLVSRGMMSLSREPVAKLFGTPLITPLKIEAMYLESIRRFSRQYSKIFRFTVRNMFSIVSILSS